MYAAPEILRPEYSPEARPVRPRPRGRGTARTKLSRQAAPRGGRPGGGRIAARRRPRRLPSPCCLRVDGTAYGAEPSRRPVHARAEGEDYGRGRPSLSRRRPDRVDLCGPRIPPRRITRRARRRPAGAPAPPPAGVMPCRQRTAVGGRIASRRRPPRHPRDPLSVRRRTAPRSQPSQRPAHARAEVRSHPKGGPGLSRRPPRPPDWIGARRAHLTESASGVPPSRPGRDRPVQPNGSPASAGHAWTSRQSGTPAGAGPTGRGPTRARRR